MSDPTLNPSQQVERIREILVGRELGRMERRLTSLEQPQRQATQNTRMAETQQAIIRETQELKNRIHLESTARQQQMAQLSQKISNTQPSGAAYSQLEKQLNQRVETLASELTARIDARTREILHHLQNEILQWKNEMDRDLQSIRDVKADRKDVGSRFAKIAAAAMEDENENQIQEGFLL